MSCPAGWEREGDRCYFFSEEEKTWFEAEEACIKRGGHLASVNNEQVHTYLQGQEFRGWVGGTDLNTLSSGQWTWTDCSGWDFNSGWAPHQPRHVEEHCLEYYYYDAADTYLWDNKACTRKKVFVCSIKLCPGIVSNISKEKCNIFHPQTMFLKFKRMDATQMNAHRSALILAGRREKATATSGARRSCSGERLRRNAGAWKVTWPLSPPKMSMTTCT